MSQFNENIFKGTLVINPSNTMDMRFAVIEKRYSKFNGSITVRKDTQLKINGIMSVPLFENVDKFNSTITITKEANKTFKGTLLMNPSNKMDISLSVSSPFAELLYKGNLTNKIENTDKFKARLLVQPTTKLFGSITIQGFGQNVYRGSLTNAIVRTVKQPSLLNIPLFETTDKFKGRFANKIEFINKYKCKFIIPPMNTLFGKVDLLETPKNNYYGTLVKDSHVISTNQEANYGSAPELYFSKNSVVYLQWRFFNNNDENFKSENELETFLRLYLKKAVQTVTTGSVYLTSTSWTEYGITYQNKPEITKLTDFTLPINSVDQIDIPLGDILKSYSKFESFNVSLAVVLNTDLNNTNNSRETAFKIPSLYYQYYYVPPTLRIKRFEGLLTIRKDTTTAFKGTMKVQSGMGLDKFKGNFTVHANSNTVKYNGNIFIINEKHRNKMFKGVLNIPSFNGDVKYPGMMINRLERLKKFNSTINIPSFDGSVQYRGNLTVSIEKTTKFKSTITVPIFENSTSFKGSITNRIDKQSNHKGTITVPIFENATSFKGSITNRIDKQSNHKGTINVPLFENTVKYKGSITNRLERVLKYEGLIITPVFEQTPKFKGTINIRIDRDPKYKGIITVPLFTQEPKYQCSLVVPYRKILTFDGILNVPLFENTVKYKGVITNVGTGLIQFKARLRIKGGKHKVRIFIM